MASSDEDSNSQLLPAVLLTNDTPVVETTLRHVTGTSGTIVVADRNHTDDNIHNMLNMESSTAAAAVTSITTAQESKPATSVVDVSITRINTQNGDKKRSRERIDNSLKSNENISDETNTNSPSLEDGVTTAHHPDGTSRPEKKFCCEDQTIKETKSFAPSIKEYLKQARKRRSGSATTGSTSSGTVELKYLPRPEWCRMVSTLMISELVSEKFKSEIDVPTIIALCATDYRDMVRHCSMEMKKTNDDIILIPVQSHSNPEKVDFINTQLACNVIYFDEIQYIWKTKRIDTDPTISHRIESTAVPTTKKMLVSEMVTHPFLYQALVHPPKISIQRQTFGKDRDTILHVVIRENITILAIDIIRIEYNTFLDLVQRENALTKECLYVTLLHKSNGKGMTPLILAAQKGNLPIVQELLLRGVSFSDRTSNGTTAVLQAAHFGHAHVIQYLIDHYQTHNEEQMGEPRNWFWPESLKEMIDTPSTTGTTPLMRAAQEGRLSTVNLLLAYDTNVNLENDAQMTPLMLAAQRGHAQICRQLIQHGARVNHQTKQNSTALLLACKRGHVAVVKELVTAGCDLHLTDDRNRTAYQIVQRRMQRRHDTTEPVAVTRPPPTHNRPPNRQRGNARRRSNRDIENHNIDGNVDGDEGDEGNLISLRTDQKLLRMLNTQSQIELMQFSVRVLRNYEMVRIYQLIQQNRVDVKINCSKISYDIPTTVELLNMLTTNTNMGEEATVAIHRSSNHSPCEQPSVLPFRFADISKQVLIRSMTLPAPLIQAITLFLALPRLWNKRIIQIESSYLQKNPNVAIVYALDIIDEILEDGGFLSALEVAKIPPPNLHQTWLQWKHRARPRAEWSDHSNLFLNNIFATPRSSNITESVPPRPQDELNPSICEMRRQVGYLPLLKKYQSHTKIVKVLMDKPYYMSDDIIYQLIQAADIASICRRSCIEPLFAPSLPVAVVPPRNDANVAQSHQIVHFQPNTALRIIGLAFDLSSWYNSECHATSSA